MLRITKVWIEWIVDENADLSYLTTDAKYYYGDDGSEWNHVGTEVMREVMEVHGSILNACKHYAKEDFERLRAYHRDEWQMMGCVAKAKVMVPCDEYCRIEEFSSPGLWGIESDAGEDYRTEIEGERLTCLKAYLEQFGVDTSDFEKWREKCLL